MKKDNLAKDDDLWPEYDFSKMKGGVRGKYAKRYQSGIHSVTIHKADGKVLVHYFGPPKGLVVLAPDVQKHFSTSRKVNQALRSLIRQTHKKAQPSGKARAITKAG